MPFSSEDHPWLRREKEPARAYAAFALYRDLGARRTVVEALREYRAQRGVEKREGNQIRSGLPAARRRWRKDWAWDERLEAFDKHSADMEAAAEAEIEEARVKTKVQRRREHEEVRYRRLIQVSERLQTLLGQPL